MINNCIKKLQNWLFMPSCVVCAAPGEDSLSICSICIGQLKHNKQCCSRCSLPLATETRVLCPQCQSKPPDFNTSFIPFQYRGEIISLVRNFKFHGNLTSGKVLADLFCQKLKNSDVALPETLVPVPLHPSRTRQRGFNQALWLAQQIGKQMSIAVDPTLLKRQLKSESQHQLDKKARLKNLQGVFRLQTNNVSAHIAIIDDVVTTGATANAVANTIKSAFNHSDSNTIQLWAIARTPLE